MAERERPVWAWLPGHTTPVHCGAFCWEPGIGRFSYTDEYRRLEGRLPIDPINLPITRSTKPDRTDSMNGVFGVLRDAAPEGFGLDLLVAKHGREALDEVERMDLAPGDAVGAIEVCAEEFLGRKVAFSPPSEEKLLRELENVDPGISARRVVQSVAGMVDSTSLGGEKPKLTVARNVDGVPQWWIAKLQERGGSPLLPTREYVAMTLARQCGLDVAEVAFRRIGPHEVVLVKRFDRKVTPAGVERSLFASAATALRLRSDATREDDARSYTGLSAELRRWCARGNQSADGQQQELWRRMAFNALVSNIDDHPRNHGLLYRDGGWGLSPAYDIVSMPNQRGGHAMGINRKRLGNDRVGERVATPTALLFSAELFSYTQDEAWEILQQLARQVHESWRALFVEACGIDEEDLDRQVSAFQLAADIVSGAAAPDMTTLNPRGRRRG
jgi:serine/threonine-protein kinase HipA